MTKKTTKKTTKAKVAPPVETPPESPVLAEKPKYEAVVLARAAKAGYESWVKEAGFEHDARIKAWRMQTHEVQSRWVTHARAILDAAEFGTENRSSVPSSVRRPDDGPRKVGERYTKVATEVQVNRHRGPRSRD